MRISIDRNNSILVNGQETQLEELKNVIKDFVTPHPEDDSAPEVEWKTIDQLGIILCSKGIIFCNERDNPDIQKELLQAFNDMREDLSLKIFQKSYDKLDEEQTKSIDNAVPIRIIEEL